MIFAVVPAAGHSTRMGRPKLSLPLGNRAVLECVVGALRAGGVDRAIVVVGPHVPELAALAVAAGADVCSLATATPDMRATVEYGLRWIEVKYDPKPDDWWLLAPADHPTLDPQIVRRLVESAAQSSHSIVVPAFRGRRGHPTLLSWRHVAGIGALPADQGINTYLRTQRGETLELDVERESILADLDTPDDYSRLREQFGHGV
jgi:molybdenum cofactor cytidylyltransferase